MPTTHTSLQVVRADGSPLPRPRQASDRTPPSTSSSSPPTWLAGYPIDVRLWWGSGAPASPAAAAAVGAPLSTATLATPQQWPSSYDGFPLRVSVLVVHPSPASTRTQGGDNDGDGDPPAAPGTGWWGALTNAGGNQAQDDAVVVPAPPTATAPPRCSVALFPLLPGPISGLGTRAGTDGDDEGGDAEKTQAALVDGGVRAVAGGAGADGGSSVVLPNPGAGFAVTCDGPLAAGAVALLVRREGAPVQEELQVQLNVAFGTSFGAVSLH